MLDKQQITRILEKRGFKVFESEPSEPLTLMTANLGPNSFVAIRGKTTMFCSVFCCINEEYLIKKIDHLFELEQKVH
jgi:hypothetical protein